MDTSVSDNNLGVQHHRIFMVATLIIDILFEQFLICAAGDHSRQRTVMDNSLSDIIEVCGTITTL